MKLGNKNLVIYFSHNPDHHNKCIQPCKGCASEEQIKITIKQIYEWGNERCLNPLHPEGGFYKHYCKDCWQELLEASK